MALIDLQQKSGPGDYIVIVDEEAWCAEYGFYINGSYHILREEPWMKPRQILREAIPNVWKLLVRR